MLLLRLLQLCQAFLIVLYLSYYQLEGNCVKLTGGNDIVEPEKLPKVPLPYWFCGDALIEPVVIFVFVGLCVFVYASPVFPDGDRKARNGLEEPPPLPAVPPPLPCPADGILTCGFDV